jgi:hypothetical protein
MKSLRPNIYFIQGELCYEVSQKKVSDLARKAKAVVK